MTICRGQGNCTNSRKHWHFAASLLIAAVCAASLAANALAASRGGADAAQRDDSETQITLLEGEPITSRITAVADGKLTLADGRSLALADVRRINRPASGDAARNIGLKRPNARVFLAGGGCLNVDAVTVQRERVQLQWGPGGEVELPLTAIRGVETTVGYPDVEVSERYARGVADLTAEADQLYVLHEGRVVVVPGLFDAMDENAITFIPGSEPRSIDRTRVLGFTLANARAATPGPDGAAQQDTRAPATRVHLADGSEIRGRVVSLADGWLTVRLPLGERAPTIRTRWSAVQRIDLRSDRLVFLSEIDPLSVEQDPGLDVPRPWRRDHNVMGGPIRLGGVTYEQGLGVRSMCELTYAIDGQYETFAAVIGLDDSTGDLGDCEFVVEVDGREAIRVRQRGTDPPRPIEVSVEGGRRLTLRVAFGEDLSLSDHANWADARIVKAPPSSGR